MKKEILSKLCEIFSELGSAVKISDGAQLLRDMGLDSLRMVMLLIKLEEKFDIVLDESDMNPFDLISVQHVVDLVEKYVDSDKDENEEEN